MAWCFDELINVQVTPQKLGLFFQKLLRKKSFLVIVVGDPGSGKSLTVGSIMEKINPETCKKDVIDIIGNVKPRFREILKERETNRNRFFVINLDDFGSELDANEYNRVVAKQTSWLFQKDRPLKIGCFLTVPDKGLINKTFRERIPNFYMEVLGHNESTGYAEIKFHRIQVNKRTTKVYHHRLLWDLESEEIRLKEKIGHSCIPLRTLKIPKPSNKFLHWYIPFRYEMSMKQLDDSSENGEPIKSKENTTMEVYNDIIANNKLGLYVRTSRTGRITVDTSGIEVDYGIGGKKSAQVESLIKRKYLNDS